MKRTALLLSLMLAAVSATAQWKAAGDRIRTPWAGQVNPSATLQEYPRPQMVRTQWVNLNGLWDYAILPLNCNYTESQGKILVPFAVESALSGVGRTVGEENNLWYSRNFTVPKEWKGKRVILHFGAVDWKTEVWVNDVKVASHTGGYTPFECDVTDALNGGNNSLKVKVWDPTDEGYQPRGKQVNEPEGIWYTSVTGIWQTVWMEPVAQQHISSLRITPDLDRSVINVKAEGVCKGIVSVAIKQDGKVVGSAKAVAGMTAEVVLDTPRLWTPDDPYLYDMEVTFTVDGKLCDKVGSYCAMRKISSVEDKDGIKRMALNNRPIFMLGPLDQGWWPDGLYTAPTDEALAFDVQKTKDMGFNMIRKHVKVEPARWYYHCDRLGIMVWQDMPSGDLNGSWTSDDFYKKSEFVRSVESEDNYRTEWKEIMDYLYSSPCVVVWVPFNEGWGQFKTVEIASWTKYYDSSRLVNPASGGNHFLFAGDILDLHHYPMPELYLSDAKRILVLGEYGGIGFPVKDHLWTNDRNWGYIKFESSKDVTDEYVKYGNSLLDYVGKGFSAGVYTQTTDVEIEVNGLMTYDRKIDKVEIPRVKEINSRLCHSLDNK